MLQHTATHCNAAISLATTCAVKVLCCSVLQCVVAHTLCVAVCGSMRQCAPVCGNVFGDYFCSVLLCIYIYIYQNAHYLGSDERWGAGVKYHFQEFNEPYAPS